jgi:hypothetical protein
MVGPNTICGAQKVAEKLDGKSERDGGIRDDSQVFGPSQNSIVIYLQKSLEAEGLEKLSSVTC